MIPLIIALTTAALFLGLSILIYGADVLAENAWVALVFWGLIGSGLTLYLINRPTPRWMQRLRDWCAETAGSEHAHCGR